MKTKFDVDYFIKKFEAIPENLFTTDTFRSDGQYCALGLCGMNYTNSKWAKEPINRVPESILEARSLLEVLPLTTAINDGNNSYYQQPTPKQRVLAALYDIKTTQQPKAEEPKERTVYVVISEKIKEQTKELILN